MVQEGPPVRGGPQPPPFPDVREGAQGYADITKLRELCAHHERLASKSQARSARIQTRIERFRHTAALLREKAQAVLQQIPELEQEMVQHERDIKAFTAHTMGRRIGSDVTELHYKIKKVQQRIVDVQHKARTLEHKAAIRTQKAAEFKIKSDRYLGRAKFEQQQADQYRDRADRLQLATERGEPVPPPAPVPLPAPATVPASPDPGSRPAEEPPDDL